MNRVVKTLLCLIVMILIFAADGFALDKYYLLKKGNIARNILNPIQPPAIPILINIIREYNIT